MQWCELHVPQMDCSEELHAIRKRLADVPGVTGVEADYLRRTLRVAIVPEHVAVSDVVQCVESLGFACRQAAVATPTAAQPRWEAKDLWVAAGGLVLIAATAVWAGQQDSLWAQGLAVVSALLAGSPVCVRAVRAARALRLDMNVLMTIAAVGAVLIGDHFEAATAMVLFGAANWLESRSYRRAGMAMASLVELTPEVAHRYRHHEPVDVKTFRIDDIRSDQIEDVDPESILTGDVILVRPGERIPVDGTVLFGQSTVSEAHITGESLPAEKHAGTSVYAGSQNGSGAVTILATSTSGDSATARVAQLVAASRSKPSDSERLVDRFAGWYTPAVILLALFVGLVLPLAWTVTGQSLNRDQLLDWLHQGLVLLVIACPCALVVSTPITMICGLHRATNLGVVVKGAVFLEQLGTIRSIAFDKTGTLTDGLMQVEAVEPQGSLTEEDVLARAAALEIHSEHPLADAIVAAAMARGIQVESATELQIVRGQGILGNWRGQRLMAGNSQFLATHGIGSATPEQATPQATPLSGAVPMVLVAHDHQLIGRILLSDPVRSDARQAVQMLRQLNIARIAMLTGDREDVAQSIAHQVGIEEVYSQLLPEDKIIRIESLQRDGPAVMVGDGINDAPALLAADIGVGMGHGASDLAVESADVVVLSAHLTRVPLIIALARHTRRVLWQNIGLALVIKLLVLVLTGLGWGSMWMAVAADVGASLFVVANGMRLLTWQPVTSLLRTDNT